MFQRARLRDWWEQVGTGRSRRLACSPSRQVAPVMELLEGRRLLSGYTGPATRRTFSTDAGVFLIQVSGPGALNVFPGGAGAINLKVYGTSSDSTVTVTQVRPRYHAPSRLLNIHTLTVTSGQLGDLDASPAILTGAMTPINSPMSNLDWGAIGPAAKITANGSVTTMNVGTINLGPTGRVILAAGLNTSSTSSSSTNGLVTLGMMTAGVVTINGGQFDIGQDAVEPITVNGNMTITHDGVFSVGRDLDGSLTVGGNLVLDTGGQIFVGRNLEGLYVDGNLIVNPSGSGIVVNGALSNLVVNGYFQGQGGTSTPTLFDIGVNLSIVGLTVNGGNNTQDGLINANIRAGSSISGVSIAYGSVNSTIAPNTPPPV
jgi:hypothetical protein